MAVNRTSKILLVRCGICIVMWEQNLNQPKLFLFTDWLKEEAEAPERMKATSIKHRSDEVSASTVKGTKNPGLAANTTKSLRKLNLVVIQFW